TVSGTVSGADVKAGDTVTVYIGSKTHQAQVTAEKTFSVQVSATELANSQTHEVRAELNVRNAQNEAVTVSDRATYTVAPKMSGHFVSEHGKVDVSTMPYFMQAMPYDTSPADYGHQSEGRKHTLGTGVNLKIHFVTAAEFVNDNTTERVEYDEPTKEAVRNVFRKIGQSVNVTFEEVASQQDADINFYMENFALFTGERAKFNDAAGIARYGGFVSLNSNLYVKEADGWEKYDGFHTTMHEIFHSMGLKHPHDGNILLNKVEDSTALTSMSYEHDKDFVDIHDMRIFDMAYLHYRYGVAKGARTGNDTYSFKPFNTKTADGDVYIWDGGGVDAFDASAEKQGVYVNLTPGSWIYSGKRTERFVLSDMVETTFNAYTHFGVDTNASLRNNWKDEVYDPSFVEGQAFIGYGTQIENLIGSAHNDVLIGNNADNVIHGGAGADTLEGGLGNDWLDGGAGADILRGGAGNDFYLIDSAQDRIEESDNNGR
ncbi:matrixin family metalloprotease, partial [Conchiformibius steedae]|uniref:matrixin family metalloprotease n=1 Tax=Conchiformibius steedae TaxID=153493 RepID=UPI0026EFE7E3